MSSKSLVDRLLMRAHATVLLVGAPADHVDHLGETARWSPPIADAAVPTADFIQVFDASHQELEALLPSRRACLAPKGALWITYHRTTSHGKSDIKRDSIWTIVKQHGLRAVRQVSVDEVWSALRCDLA